MNSVNIIGKLRDVIDEKHRYFAYERPYKDEGGEDEPQIVVKYWTNQSKSRLMLLPSHTRVAIHGHLDTSEKFATILVVEQLQTMNE